MNEVIRAFEAQIDSVVEGERAVVARINTAGVDRLKTVIDPLGCDVSHFNKTRSVLWNHGQDKVRGYVPIGQGWAKVRRSERDILGKTSFGNDEFSDLLFEKYKSGELRGWSIKAGVHESSPPTREEIRSRPELADCETIYRKWDLIEFSATPIPGNSDCVSLLVSRGLITAPEGFVPEPTVEKPIVRTTRYVDADGAAWAVREPDGAVIARFRDEPTAIECLRAMTKTRSLDQVLVSMHTQHRAMLDHYEEDLIARLELKLFGKI